MSSDLCKREQEENAQEFKELQEENTKLRNKVKMSEIQKKAIKEKCPNCKEGDLHEVEGEVENYLWCNSCDLSMDSCGGYTC